MSKLSESDVKLITTIATTCTQMAGLVAGVTADSLLQTGAVTDAKINSVAGEQSLSPTSNQTQLQEGSARGADTAGTLAKEETSAQKGSVQANVTEANAADQKANASETGATALITEAGATEIATKAMKMN